MTVQVRPAEERDMAVMLDFGAALVQRLHGPELDREHAAATLRWLMQSEHLLVAELDGNVAGVLGAAVLPHAANPAHANALEVIFWVDHGNCIGLRLMREMEQLVRDRGADAMVIPLPVQLDSEAVRAVYRAAGYAPSETYFKKGL